MYRRPEFLYFDLGKVILHFSHARMCQQVADALGAPVAEVQAFLFSPEVHLPYERGQMSTDELLVHLNRRFDGELQLSAAVAALGDIFWLNAPIVPLLVGLKSAGYRLGLLSNTCDAHWQVATQQFSLLNWLFEVQVLSFCENATKPDAAIYQRAAEKADSDTKELFFVDDLLENVEGARSAGVDAVLFTSVPALAADLRRREIHFRY